MSVGGMAASSCDPLNDVRTCQAIGASAATQNATMNNLEILLMAFQENCIQSGRRESENSHGGDGKCGHITKVEIPHVRLVRVDGNRLRRTARTTTGHHPNQIEDGEGLNSPKEHRDEHERDQVRPGDVAESC